MMTNEQAEIMLKLYGWDVEKVKWLRHSYRYYATLKRLQLQIRGRSYLHLYKSLKAYGHLP